MDILKTLHEHAWVRVYFSIPFADDQVARKVETQAPSITKRFEAMACLAQAGIPTHVFIAPVIPGLSEHNIPAILRRAREVGAVDASYILLRLNGNVESVFLERMAQAFPDRIKKIVNRVKEVRGGVLSEKRFFARHQGQGSTWDAMQQLFDTAYRQAGFPLEPAQEIPHTFTRPRQPEQPSLF